MHAGIVNTNAFDSRNTRSQFPVRVLTRLQTGLGRAYPNNSPLLHFPDTKTKKDISGRILFPSIAFPTKSLIMPSGFRPTRELLMPNTSSERTPQTLLARLRHCPDDAEAWGSFVRRYGPVVYSWCGRKGLQAADAEDVTQGVFVDLCKQMCTFVYDPTGSFRKWLSRMTHNACVDFMNRRRRHPPGTGDSAVQALLEAKEAPDELAAGMEAEAERELFEEAQKIVRRRVEPRTFEAFTLTAVQGLKAPEAARQLNLSLAAV